MILDIPTWHVKAAESAFVYGPSGCGKSTLLNILSGIITPTSGEAIVCEHHLDRMSTRARDQFRANIVGQIFQEFNLIPYLNGVENIQLARHFGRNHAQSKLESEALLEQLNIEPHHWYKPVNELSLGQQQRIAIARALVNKPKLLIADEPTSSLDNDNRDRFMALLFNELKQNQTTLVFISHDLSLGQYFDRIDSLAELNLAHTNQTQSR